MSEEEIIEELKRKIEYLEEADYMDLDRSDIEVFEGIIDLYNKEKETSHYIQSQLDIANAKLLEEKEKNKKLNLENQALYESINCNDDNMLARRYDKLKKELEKANKQLDLDYVDNNFVSKDKIKDKIKDIKRELEILEKKNDCSMIYNPKDICKAEILRLEEILEEN